jgi:cytochrome oxidase assembly protein ShyY1
MFTPIAWNNLFYVAIAALIATALVVSLFSFGIRFFVNAETAKVKASAGEIKALRTEAANRALSYALFALGFGAVIYGVLLIVPGVIPAIK